MYISGVTFSLRYYGLKHKEQIEKYTYFYAYSRAKLLSLLPGKKGKFQNNILIMFLKIIITWINTIIQYHKIKCSIYILSLFQI